MLGKITAGRNKPDRKFWGKMFCSLTGFYVSYLQLSFFPFFKKMLELLNWMGKCLLKNSIPPSPQNRKCLHGRKSKRNIFSRSQIVQKICFTYIICINLFSFKENLLLPNPTNNIPLQECEWIPLLSLLFLCSFSNYFIFKY